MENLFFVQWCDKVFKFKNGPSKICERQAKETNKQKKTKIQKKAKETKEDISGKSILKNAAARVKIFSSPTFPETRLFFLATATETFEKGMVCLQQAIGLQIF